MSIEYRLERFVGLSRDWELEMLRPLVGRWKINDPLWRELRNAVGNYVAAALYFAFDGQEDHLINNLDTARASNRFANVTPNGAVVPKKEYEAEYNQVLRVWCDLMRSMVSAKPEWVKKVRVTPNVRIKFGIEIEENLSRGLNTSLPHSDAWVEGAFGMNCYVPIFGDVDRNTLVYYQPDSRFREEFLKPSNTYSEMQWVMEYYSLDTELKTPKGFVFLSDFAVVHETHRALGAGTRVSIDTTFLPGDHEVHPDREMEYMDHIPRIGVDAYVKCHRSVNDPVAAKNTNFSHYTTGSLEFIKL